jgi:hypothetical protein
MSAATLSNVGKDALMLGGQTIDELSKLGIPDPHEIFERTDHLEFDARDVILGSPRQRVERSRKCLECPPRLSSWKLSSWRLGMCTTLSWVGPCYICAY